jgi:hypothetical protein
LQQSPDTKRLWNSSAPDALPDAVAPTFTMTAPETGTILHYRPIFVAVAGTTVPLVQGILPADNASTQASAAFGSPLLENGWDELR